MNNLFSSIVTWTWFVNKWWPGYGECDVIILFNLYLKAPGYKLSYACNREYQAGLEAFWFWSKHSAFSCSLHSSKLPTQVKEVNRRYSTLSPLTDTHYHCTLWKSSFSFLIVFCSLNKELDYKFSISSSVHSCVRGTLDFSHREK